MVTNHHAIDHPRQPGSMGVPTPGIRAVVVDEQCRELGPGVPGPARHRHRGVAVLLVSWLRRARVAARRSLLHHRRHGRSERGGMLFLHGARRRHHLVGGLSHRSVSMSRAASSSILPSPSRVSSARPMRSAARSSLLSWCCTGTTPARRIWFASCRTTLAIGCPLTPIRVTWSSSTSCRRRRAVRFAAMCYASGETSGGAGGSSRQGIVDPPRLARPVVPNKSRGQSRVRSLAMARRFGLIMTPSPGAWHAWRKLAAGVPWANRPSAASTPCCGRKN